MTMQWMSIIRDVLKIGGPIIATYFAIDEETWLALTGAAMTIIGFVWTRFASSPKAVVAEAAATVSVPAASQAEVGITHPVSPSH